MRGKERTKGRNKGESDEIRKEGMQWKRRRGIRRKCKQKSRERETLEVMTEKTNEIAREG